MLFEHAPRFVERLSAETAGTMAELLDRAESIARDMPQDAQLELIDGHPRIGAHPASVSETSFREQGYDHSPATADEELADRLASLNDEYENRFGFRFVVFVAGRPRSEIAEFFESRLTAGRDEELERALSDVFAIARDRLSRLNVPQEA